MNQRDMGRRDFMKTLGLAGTAALLAGRARAADEAGKAPAASQKVPTRPFGKAGVNVASLALGGAFGVPCNALLLDLALKHGVTYWDTADCYGNGNSELGLGQFFEKFPAARKQVFLVTKDSNRGARLRVPNLDGSTQSDSLCGGFYYERSFF